jgi:outer membrane protein assembly factor BamB
MRTLPILLVLSACADPAAGELAWRATLTAPTNGIGLHKDGVTGHAGMYGTNCPFETVGGQVTGDQDLPEEGEEVQDVGTSSLGDDTVVLVLPPNVFLLDKGTGSYVQDDFVVEGVRESRLADDGIVALRGAQGSCAIDWFDGHTVVGTTELATCPADVAFDVDPRTGDAVVVSPEGIAFARPGEVVTTGTTGDLVSWDLDAGVIYVASAGGTGVTALAPDGTVRWQAEVSGPIAAMAATGTPGGAALSVEGADGDGELVVLDAATGAMVAQIRTPAVATGVATSPDGTTIGLVRPDAVHFYVVSR